MNTKQIAERSTKLIILFSLVLTFSCLEKKQTNDVPLKNKTLDDLVEVDDDFGDLVIVDSLGVTGADGVISFPLNDTISIFMMGDSFLTKVIDRKRDVNTRMINNTFILVNEKQGSHTALYNGTLEDASALLRPAYGNPSEYYWPGHGFIRKDILHIFMSRFLHVDYGWGFEFSGTDYIRMDGNSFEVLSQENFPYSNQNNVHYGHSIINEEDYTYLYGSWSGKDSTGLHVARTTLDGNDNKLHSYEFYNGETWVSNPMLSRPLKGIDKDVPEQFSVFRFNDVYVLIMEDRSLINGNIFSYISDAPVGPWRNEKLLFHTLEQENYSQDQVFTYNAMAHPQYIKDDKLLISYCVNSFDVPKIHLVNTDYYRPRFIRVPMDLILR